MFMPALIPGQVGMGSVTLPASIFLMVLGGGFVFAARFDRFKTPIVEATSEPNHPEIPETSNSQGMPDSSKSPEVKP